MPFKWSLNPYMGCEHRCTFCYVRAFEKRADRPSDDRYGRTIRVKTNIAAVLRQELSRRSWRFESVVIGAATDPYQPAEGTYRLTRACLKALADHANPGGLITRGPMIVRDIDVLTDLARRAAFSVTFSIPTLDEEVWRRTEPGTAHPRQRLKAISQLVAAGIKAAGFFMVGYLGETTDSLIRSINFSSSLPLDYVSYTIAYPLPGTGFYDRVHERRQKGEWHKVRHNRLLFNTDFSENKLRAAILKGAIQHRLNKLHLRPAARVFELATNPLLRVLR